MLLTPIRATIWVSILMVIIIISAGTIGWFFYIAPAREMSAESITPTPTPSTTPTPTPLPPR